MPDRSPATTMPARPRWAQESGQTLMELLIAALMTAFVIGAIGSLLVLSQRQQQKNANYDFAQSSTQEQLDRMVGQIRDAWNIVSWSGNAVDFDININGSPYQVYYECDVAAGNSWNECVRLQTAVGATLPALSTGTVVVPFLSNGTTTNPVFSWTSEQTAPVGTTTVTTAIAPDYVTATVDVPASAGKTAASLTINRTIAFSSGALIPNVDVEN